MPLVLMTTRDVPKNKQKITPKTTNPPHDSFLNRQDFFFPVMGPRQRQMQKDRGIDKGRGISSADLAHWARYIVLSRQMFSDADYTLSEGLIYVIFSISFYNVHCWNVSAK